MIAKTPKVHSLADWFKRIWKAKTSQFIQFYGYILVLTFSEEGLLVFLKNIRISKFLVKDSTVIYFFPACWAPNYFCYSANLFEFFLLNPTLLINIYSACWYWIDISWKWNSQNRRCFGKYKMSIFSYFHKDLGCWQKNTSKKKNIFQFWNKISCWCFSERKNTVERVLIIFN